MYLRRLAQHPVLIEGNKSFEFVIGVPGFRADFHEIEVRDHYSPDEIRDLDAAGLRAFLESLPCCVLGGDRETPGDPMNIAVVGEGDHVLATFVRRGWDMTETVRAGTAWRTALSSVFGSR